MTHLKLYDWLLAQTLYRSQPAVSSMVFLFACAVSSLVHCFGFKVQTNFRLYDVCNVHVFSRLLSPRHIRFSTFAPVLATPILICIKRFSIASTLHISDRRKMLNDFDRLTSTIIVLTCSFNQVKLRFFERNVFFYCRVCLVLSFIVG